MADLNSVALVGRLTADAVFKTLPSGTPLVEFSVANNRGYGDNKRVNYVRVKFWGKGGQAIKDYLVKGKAVSVTGELQYETWNDKSGGAVRNTLIVSTFDVSLLADGKGSQGLPTMSKPVYTAESVDDGYDDGVAF